MDKELIMIGTYTLPILFGTGDILEGKGKGIYAYELDRATGVLTQKAEFAGIDNPSYICKGAGKENLYSVNELKEFNGEFGGSVSAFRFDEENMTLTHLGSFPTGGTDPCHVAVDSKARRLYAANFMSGSEAVFPILEDGSIAEKSQFFQYEGSSINPKRQTNPHAHSTVFDNAGHRAFVPDLGTDKLWRYDIAEDGSLVNESFLKLEPGSGPRHGEFSSDGRFLYLIKELASKITVLTYDAESGEFDEIQNISTLPEGADCDNICADIHMTPDGRYLYGSNRGHNSIVCFERDAETGLLTVKAHCSCGGGTPRSFAVDPEGEWLLCANQDSDNIVSFKIDAESGELTKTGEVFAPTPVCVKFWR